MLPPPRNPLRQFSSPYGLASLLVGVVLSPCPRSAALFQLEGWFETCAASLVIFLFRGILQQLPFKITMTSPPFFMFTIHYTCCKLARIRVNWCFSDTGDFPSFLTHLNHCDSSHSCRKSFIHVVDVCVCMCARTVGRSNVYFCHGSGRSPFYAFAQWHSTKVSSIVILG